MQIPVTIADQAGSVSLEEMAYVWRGECLDLFSAGEGVVSNCLEAVRDSSLQLSKESSHPGFAARARSLSEVLAQARFSGHSRKALRFLDEWRNLYSRRVWLAHGKMEIHKESISLRYCDYSDGNLKISEPAKYTSSEMDVLLQQLRQGLRRMEQQFGQIAAACKRGEI